MAPGLLGFALFAGATTLASGETPGQTAMWVFAGAALLLAFGLTAAFAMLGLWRRADALSSAGLALERVAQAEARADLASEEMTAAFNDEPAAR